MERLPTDGKRNEGQENSRRKRNFPDSLEWNRMKLWFWVLGLKGLKSVDPPPTTYTSHSNADVGQMGP